MAFSDLKVPPLGESVTEATVAKWLKKVGDFVNMDDLLIELETEKITLEINAPISGILTDILVQEGAVVHVEDVLGRIEATSGEQTEKPLPLQHQTQPEPAERPSAKEKIPPSVRKMAAEKDLDVQQITGSGKDGRLIKEDLLLPEGFFKELPQEGKPEKPEERVKMTRLRRTIATRLKQSQNTAAMLTSFNEIDMTHVVATRQQYKEAFEKKHGIRLGFMSFFVKAAVEALKEIPIVNAQIENDDIIYKNYYDIGVAIATPQGLVVPVIRQADYSSFVDIERTIADLSQKARAGSLSMSDLTGGTFTITNGGTFGSLLSTPILNPPQSGILGMHKIQERPVAINGVVQIRPMMYVALTYDHRIVDGREAVTFLVRVKECIEDPDRMLLTI
jgi:2-oxoglutarate dehydrogenase E2 component (dihydrolipoamide succinyltransferase)